MKVYLAHSIAGAFAFDEDGNLLHYKLFPKNAEEIAKRLEELKKGSIKEDEEVLKEIRHLVDKRVASDINGKVEGIVLVKEERASELMRKFFRRLAIDLGWVDSDDELNSIITEIGIVLSKKYMAGEKKDKIVIQAIGVMESLDDMLNTLSERLREWYGLHFPEAVKAIKSHEHFARIIVKYGARDNIDDKALAKIAKTSVGMEFNSKDIAAIRKYAESVLNLYKTREMVSSYITNLMEEIAPNITAVAGPLLGAKLISLAGGMEKMAKMPASTIQLLGAEKALFRHLRGKGKPPKHGAIFMHPLVQSAPKKLRGKVARIIAAKLMLAIKMDFYSKTDKG
ncbi:MAG TPA: C/D box methylation guide ribonucleoprotein complex aNOP56 subunit, partial [Candidatus Aenigmarchaeota archaeon]|nr:C/D box methylation guide ribonucleoprotein complex aNOP56 subunit [Candidatus Aenigmarchaeota archaeon]